MRPIRQIALILGAALLAAGSASAQGPRPFEGGPGGPGGPMLLLNKGVREELKLSDEQVGKIHKAADDLREKRRDEMQKIRDLDPKDRRGRAEERMKVMREEVQKTLSGILTSEQAHRFRQIERQQHAFHALTEPEVRDRLKLTDDQVSKIKDIDEDVRKDMREAMRGAEGKDGEGRRRDLFEKAMAERKEANAKATALLTEEQKSSWKELVGEPFEVKWDRPAGRDDR